MTARTTPKYGPLYLSDELALGTRVAFHLDVENTTTTDARMIAIAVRCEMATIR